MTHEKIINKRDGRVVKLVVSLIQDTHFVIYYINAYWKRKGDKEFSPYPEPSLIASKRQIHTAKLELWEKLKPTL